MGYIPQIYLGYNQGAIEKDVNQTSQNVGKKIY